MLKKIPYGKQVITKNDIDHVVKVLNSELITQGDILPAFEKVIAKYHGAKYGVAFCNGTAALHGAYSAIGTKPDDELITSPITFASSANGGIFCGAIPRFVDIDPQTNCLDVDKLKDAITNKTKVITPVSFAGYPVDLRQIHAIAKQNDCFLIHDAAHAIASRRDHTFGMEYVDMAVLSFHPVKHITTGEGGMVLTNDETLYKKLLLFRTHGITKDKELLNKNDGPWYYEMQSLGYNYRMTDFQAALGLSQFERIDENIVARNRIAKRYHDELKSLDYVELPPEMGFDIIEDKMADNVHSYHLFTIQIKDSKLRKPLYEYLHQHNILVQIHYIPLHLQPYYSSQFGFKQNDYPTAEEYYSKTISLPMYHSMNEDEQTFVIDALKRFAV